MTNYNYKSDFSVRIKDLEIKFGPRVLFSNVNLTLNSGNKYGLVGHNGSGKSTLLSILAFADTPSSGEIIYPPDITIGSLS